jgi:enolase-phosphatase E1
VTIRLADLHIGAVLLDIEGTTTPIAFVHDTLFPFARAQTRAWLEESAGSLERAEIVTALRTEHELERRRGEDVTPWPADAPDTENAPVVAYVFWLMDRDRKSPPLKRLQGLIWERGYQTGALKGVVYPDVPNALRRWRKAGIEVAIYSSGSELAQRRLFESTEAGDLTPLISQFFDTHVGSKRESASYELIAGALGQEPSSVLFVSDVTAELRAAEQGGCRVVHSIRPGNPTALDDVVFAAVHSFAEIT